MPPFVGSAVMSSESLCLRVRRDAGETARRLLVKISLLNARQKIVGDGASINIPLLREPSSTEWMEIREVDPGAATVAVESGRVDKVQRPRNVAELLKGRVDPDLLAYVSHSFDVIGDIAVIEVPPESGPLKRLFAEAILEVHKGVRTVLCKTGAVDGKFRVRTYEHVLGEVKTIAMHKENGCRYLSDVTKAYFSPRLATEHLRVASQVSANEVVVDMFAGIGPFSILIAKMKGANVHAIDANPYAIEYMKTNCELNKVGQLVEPVLGDAREVIMKDLVGVATRVIMNLPSESLDFMDAACLALRPGGGVVHSYQFQSAPKPIDKAVGALRLKVESIGRRLHSVIGGRLVRSYAPRQWQVVVDAFIE
jgi:tRNA (guanine37-N1)-methyltransferase